MGQLSTWVNTEYVYGCIISTFREGLKQLSAWKIFPKGSTCFVEKETWAKMKIYAYSRAVVSDQGPGRDRLTDWIWGNLGAGLMNRPRRVGTKCTQIGISRVRVYQRARTTDETLTTTGTKWLGRLMSASLHHKISQCRHSGHMSKLAVVAETEVRHSPKAWPPTCQRCSSYCCQPASYRNQHWAPDKASFIEETKRLLGGKLTILHILLSQECQKYMVISQISQLTEFYFILFCFLLWRKLKKISLYVSSYHLMLLLPRGIKLLWHYLKKVQITVI